MLSIRRFAGAYCLLGVLVLVAVPLWGQDEIDFAKARQLRQKMAQGEKLTDDERAYLEKAIQARRAAARQAARQPGRLGGPSIGLKPLTDMAAGETYKGQDGGLYGQGRNEPPDELLAAAMKAAGRIQPLDAQGRPSADGKIVLVSVGMSNTTQEFSQFQRLAADDGQIAPHVVLVDGAQGGMDSRAWALPDRPERPGRPDPWTVLEQRLRQAGVTPQQVQAVWLKQARINPAGIGEFPRHAEELKGHMQAIVRKLQTTYPNLRIVYLSSRIYAGYAGGALNPEPYAYESAFAVRRLIQEQFEPAASKEASRPADASSPVLLWGPYLWADGQKGRRFDALVYERDDLAADGTHPSPSGRRKVAEQLLGFFKTHPTSKPWFTRR